MSHKCIRCGNVYEDNDASILRGCINCGSIFFLYIKTAADIEEMQRMQAELQAKETTLEQELTKQIEEKKSERKEEKARKVVEKKVEEEVKEIVAPRIRKKKALIKKIKREREKFGIETLRIPREGVYEINIDALMKKRPLIIYEKGRAYIIHLPSVFAKVRG